MNLITLDFETYYDVGFSLSNLTTEEYVNNLQFQVIGVAIKIDEEVTKWHAGEQISKALACIDWKNAMLLCHNTQFDGTILKWTYGHEPAGYFDTLSMARALHGVDVGGSLKVLAERYKLGEKGTEVLNAKGKRLEDFQEHELHQYGLYCKNDVELTYNLFKILSKGFPFSELKLIDITLKMFICPSLRLDSTLLEERLNEVRSEKQKLLQGLMVKLQCNTEEEVRKKLASNQQFAKLLEELNVPVPLKESSITGKETFALAKTDEGFLALQEHEDSFVQDLCAVRLGTKSTIEESRIERFIDIARRNHSFLPIPLKYYGAHTGRWAGADKVNFQNLPARDKKKKALKNAILPPDNHVILNVDSSQIEARILVWLAGQYDQVELYRKNQDVYCDFATHVYNKTITKKNKTERAVGKTCILGLGYGTGWAKLKNVLKLNANIDVDKEESERIVNLYRQLNHEVVKLWDECDIAIRDMTSWPDDRASYYLGVTKCVLVTPEGLCLPNGLYIRYPNLQKDKKGGYTYESRRGKINLWGGGVVENVVQALARIVIGEQMVEIDKKYRPVLTVHDAIVCTAKKEEADEALNFVMDIMKRAPKWAQGLPVTCEGGHAENYGDC